MSDRTEQFLDEKMDEILARVGVSDEELGRQLIADLWAARTAGSEAPASRAALAMGVAALDVTDEPSGLVRTIVGVGRAVADAALDAGTLDARGALGLLDVAGAQAAAAVDAYRRAGRERREAWLSFLCHDLKNPLNTILNALWLIREHRASGNTDRFLELAERAVRKMEAGIKDLRELQSKDRTLPRTLSAPAPAPRNPTP